MKIWFLLPTKMTAIFRSSRAPAFAALCLAATVVVLGIVLDQRNTENYRSELRSHTETVANILSRRLTSRLETDTLTAEHIANLAGQDSGTAAGIFQQFIKREFEGSAHVSAIAIAPDFKLSEILTRQGADSDIHGSAIQIDREQVAADIYAFRGHSQVALLSGSQENHLTLIAPIVEYDGSSTVVSGAIAILIDEQGLMEKLGVTFAPVASAKPNLISLSWLNLAIRDLDKPSHLAFYGDDSIDDAQPISWQLSTAGAHWELLAAPHSGWQVTPPNKLYIRLAIALAGLVVILPIFVASSLISERNRNIAALKQREANLLELSQRFNLAMEASNIGIWEINAENHELFWDERASGLHGRRARQGRQLEDWLASIVPEDRLKAEAHFFNCTCTTLAANEVYRIRQEDGSFRHLRSAGASYRDPEGNQRTTGIVWDVTADAMMTRTLLDAKETSDIKNAELELALDELSNREQELEELSTKLDLALDSYHCGIWESNLSTHLETWDARMCQLHGIPHTNGLISADQWISLIHPDDRETARKTSYHFEENAITTPLLVRVPQPDGSIRYIRSIGKLQTGRDGTMKVIGIAIDVTEDAILTQQLQAAKDEADAKNDELELAKSRIEHNALHDPLTRLANRRKLDVELDRLSRASLAERQKFSILHLDLDRFKQINDTLGHAAGDAMLVHAAGILDRNVRASDIVARIGGDEFVILATGNSSAEQMGQLASRIIAEMHLPIDFEGFSCRCGVSIGIAQESGLNIDARRTLVNADIALYRAKGLGRNCHQFFTQNLQAEIISHKRTADEVLTGIDNHEFTAWYQPQFDARTMELTGVEALVRWNHPRHGILAPDRFLKIAEDLNVAATLDQIVLETALKDKMRWAARGIRIPKVSVNVSSKRLHDQNLINTLKTLDIAPGEISFELVESIFLDESDEAAAGNLDMIKALGIDIEIDDFGTGHTSIVSLLKLKPKRLKIDRQLVMPILNSPQERALVRSIIDIARSLGVETVAEGVETMQHAALLSDLGCDLLQGYAFARPLAFEDFSLAALSRWQKAAA